VFVFFNFEIIISILGLVVNIIIAVFVWEYTEKQNKANNNWLAINQHIADAEKNVLEMGYRYNQLKIETKINEKYKGHENYALDLIYKDCKVSIMDKLDAYEAGCIMYFEGKLDKIRFYEDRKIQIEDLVQNEVYKEWINPVEGKSAYENIWRFYNEEIKSKN
jgi:hypothetical protein